MAKVASWPRRVRASGKQKKGGKDFPGQRTGQGVLGRGPDVPVDREVWNLIQVFGGLTEVQSTGV